LQDIKREKSTVDEIRERFDNDVERFSNLDIGQVSAVDSKISLEIIAEAAKRLAPDAEDLLDIGCGAGNYTLKLLSKIPDMNCTLIDLSRPMLDRAAERIMPETGGKISAIQADIRNAVIPENSFDIIVASAVFHHLRDEDEWRRVFAKIYSALKPQGCLFVSDLISQENGALTDYFLEKYAVYLTEAGGEKYAQKVLEYSEKEDTPRSMTFQLDMMKNIGFKSIDVLHKNICFGAYCGIK
jgi:tRNA (cmo5U34)-methyltransferase